MPFSVTVRSVSRGSKVSVITMAAAASAAVLPVFWMVKVYVRRLFSVTVVGERDLLMVSAGAASGATVSVAVTGFASPAPVTDALLVTVPSAVGGAKAVGTAS